MQRYMQWLKQPRHRKQLLIIAAFVICILYLIFAVAYAGSLPNTEGKDPLETINSLSTFIFSAIRAIGVILLLFGVVQIGMSLKSHDPSQRSNGFLTFFGGLIIALAKEVLDLILK